MQTAHTGSGPVITAGIVRALRQFINNAKTDIDVDGLLANAGLTSSMIRKPLGYVPLAAVGEVLEDVAEALEDDCLGLRMAQHMNPGHTGLAGHLAMTAATAREALTLLAGYNSVFVSDIEAGYEEYYETGMAIGYWKYPDTIVARRQLNCFTAGALIRRLRGALGENWSPLKLELEHRKPSGCPACHGAGCAKCEELVRTVLGPNVEFNQPVNRIIHTIAGLNVPMEAANPMTNELHVDHARRAMEHRAYRYAIAERVKLEIVATLKHHDASLNVIADRLGMSARTLQGQLQNEGTNFEELLTDIRQHMAERLLRETDKPISEIAFDLGYADQSIFSRAVKRWFNQSPRDLRLSHRRSASTH